MVNDKTKGMLNIISLACRLQLTFLVVDENLFYKGVDKSAVHGARLHQTHSLSDPSEEVPEQERDPSQPPYPFHVSVWSLWICSC